MSILEQVQDYVVSELRTKLSEDNHYHSIEHTESVVDVCKEIASHYSISKPDFEDLLIASWFHDIGHIHSFEDHENKSARIAKSFLRKQRHPEDRIKKIELIIMSTSMNVPSQGLLEEIIHDADIQSIGSEDFFKIGNNLRKEWELIEGLYYDQDEWNQLQLEFLQKNDFYTEYAREKYGPMRDQNIEKAKAKLK